MCSNCALSQWHHLDYCANDSHLTTHSSFFVLGRTALKHSKERTVSADLAPHQQIRDLYSDHHRWLHNWLRRRLGCGEQAADLAHDTFLRVMTGRDVAAIGEPRGYLSTVARGLMVDLFRRRAIEAAWLDVLAAQPEPEMIALETQAIIIETLLAVDRLLDRLGSRTRAVFLLAQLDGLTQVEIGKQLRISLPTVRKHLVRAFTECLLLVAD